MLEGKVVIVTGGAKGIGRHANMSFPASPIGPEQEQDQDDNRDYEQCRSVPWVDILGSESGGQQSYGKDHTAQYHDHPSIHHYILSLIPIDCRERT